MQLEGVDFFKTYAPVVQWTTIWLMFILEVLLGLKSKQGDVTCAFLHADLAPDETVYVDMPLGCVCVFPTSGYDWVTVSA